MWGWICGATGLVLALAFVWLAFRNNVYRRVFSDEHFVEVANRIVRVAAAAFANPLSADGGTPASPDDPRVLVSSAGLMLAYTVHPREGRIVHHWSVSLSGGYTAHAVGRTFVLLTARLIGVPYERLALGIGRSTVHHAEVDLSEAEHAALRERSVPEVSAADVDALRKELIDVADRLEWAREP